MRVLGIVAIGLGALGACETTSTITDTPPAAPLTRVWTSPAAFSTPESAAYDPKAGVVYVSNMGPRDADADAVDGFVSRVTLDGETIEQRWIDDLRTPKGLSFDADRLYIADTDELIIADRASGDILVRAYIDEPAAFNGVDVGGDGAVFVNNKGYGQIWRLDGDALSLFVEDPRLEQINGVLVEPDRLLVGTSGPGELFAIDRTTGAITQLASGFGHFDAIKVDGAGGYVVSNWRGAVYAWAPGEETPRVLMDTQDEGLNAADVDYAPDEDLLFVPTFTDNRLMIFSGVAAAAAR